MWIQEDANALRFKILSMTGILIVSVVAALLPLKLRGWNQALRDKILAVFSFFTGGVFLGAGLVHMLADAIEQAGSSYRTLIFLCASLGFVVIWSIEKLRFGEHQLEGTHMVAVAAGAQDTGANICYVSVDPVTVYGVCETGSGGGCGTTCQHDNQHHRSDTLADCCHEQTSLLSTTVASKASYQSSGESKLPTASSHDNHHHHDHSHQEQEQEQEHDHHLHIDHLQHSEHSSDAHDHTGTLQTPDHKSCKQSAAWDHQVSAHPSSSVELKDHSVHHHRIHIPSGSFLLPLILALALSVHSFLAGLALGVQGALDASAVSILLAIASHKVVEALTVGSNFVKEHVPLARAVPIILIYCFMTPLGIVAGIFLRQLFTGTASVLFQAFMQAFAAGSFIYLAVHEISDERCCHIVPVWLQIVLLLTGLLAMAGLSVVV